MQFFNVFFPRFSGKIIFFKKIKHFFHNFFLGGFALWQNLCYNGCIEQGKIVMSNNHYILPVTLLMSVGFVSGVFAAPSVKVLGQKSANVSTGTSVNTTARASNMSNKANTTSQLSRVSSVRNTGTMPVRTVSANNAKVATPSSAQPASRISIGKYIHGTGVASGTIKPTTGGGSAAPASSDLVALSDRIQAVELALEEKQDKLEAGVGIDIDGKVIGVSESLQDLSSKVNTLSDAFSYVDNDTGERKYVSIVDNFNDGVLEE